MYYINFVFFYSVLGFILESVYYKYKNSSEHSSIFIGPYTFVYGFGMLGSYLLYKVINLQPNILSYIIYYIIFVLTTSLIEFFGGHIIHFFLHIDKWNYSKDKYHFGKYLTLKNCLIWGILVIIMIYYFHPFFNKYIITTIPPSFNILYLLLFAVDFIYLIKKIIKNF